MSAPHPDLASSRARCRQAVDRLMGRPPGAGDWAAEAAEALLGLAPGLRLALCRRTDGAAPVTAVRASDGSAPPDDSEALALEAGRLEGMDGAAQPSPALGAVFGLRCLAACLRDGRGPWGLLAVGAARDAKPDALELARTLLTECAGALANRRRLEDALRERDELAGFALAGQATTGLAHELNNLLNGVVLQASVLQLEVDEKLHAPLDVIRRQAAQATGLLRPLGLVSAERARGFYPVDLAHVIHDLLLGDAALAARVHFTPPADALPPIRGATSAVKQLLRLLLSAASSESPLRMHTAAAGAVVQLVVQGSDSSARGKEGQPPPTAETVVWARLGDLERAAGQSLLRQLGGEMRVEADPGGGFVLTVCWGGR
jgi:hypothetical protein